MHHLAPSSPRGEGTIGSLSQSADGTQGAAASSRHWFDFRVPIVTYEVAERDGRLLAIAKRPPKRGFIRDGTPSRGASARRTVEIFHSRRRHQRGRLSSTPLISTTSWLRGLDLNQRPLGYEGKFGH